MATLYYSKHPFSANHYQTCKATRKYDPHAGKNKQQAVPEEAQTLDLLHKNCKPTTVNILRAKGNQGQRPKGNKGNNGLTETINRDRIYKREPNRNSIVEKYNN